MLNSIETREPKTSSELRGVLKEEWPILSTCGQVCISVLVEILKEMWLVPGKPSANSMASLLCAHFITCLLRIIYEIESQMCPRPSYQGFVHVAAWNVNEPGKWQINYCCSFATVTNFREKRSFSDSFYNLQNLRDLPAAFRNLNWIFAELVFYGHANADCYSYGVHIYRDSVNYQRI